MVKTRYICIVAPASKCVHHSLRVDGLLQWYRNGLRSQKADLVVSRTTVEKDLGPNFRVQGSCMSVRFPRYHFEMVEVT